ncbi:MAG: flagellar hook-basal body complex protein FliE [Firmicutes bacterium]|nr:flagellar hook-basal body complex protein FliE [Bacillota bacterium]
MPVNPVGAGGVKPTVAASAAREGPSFAQTLREALERLNETQLNADRALAQFLTGELQDVHRVVLAMEEARLAMQLAVQVRNRVVEAYQELARMQI